MNKLPLLIFMIIGSAVLTILAFNVELINTDILKQLLIISGIVSIVGCLIVRKSNTILSIGLSVLISTLFFNYTYINDYIPTKDIYAKKMRINMNIDRIASSTDDYISVVGDIDLDGNTHKSIIYIENTDKSLFIGDNIEADAKLYYSNSEYNLGQCIFLKGYADDAYRRHRELSFGDKLKFNIENYCNTYPDNIAGLVKALLTGDKSNMDEELRNNFSISGTAHIIAVSGLHMSVLLAFCMKIFGRKAGSIIGLPMIVAYTFISGFSPSAVRAVIMSFMLVLAFFMKRDYSVYTSYFLAMYIILAVNPFSIHNVSFLLSFASVFGIIVIYPVIERRIKAIVNGRGVIGRVLYAVLTSIAVSFSAIVFSNLISARYFSRLSLISVISNIFIVIPSSVLLVLNIINYIVWNISASAAAILSKYLVVPLANMILYVNELFSDIPFASVRTSAEYLYPLLIFIAIISLLYFIIRKKLWIFVLAGIAAVCIFSYENYKFEQSNCFIDIKVVNYQPMAFIHTKDETYILGGGNGNSSNTLNFIENKLFEYNTSPDALFISKMNKANITGAIKVKDKYPECRVYGSDYTRKEYPLRYIRYKNNSVSSENISVHFETLPYNEGVITLKIGETNLLWLPSITENRLDEYFEVKAVRDADIVIIGDLYYMNRFEEKINAFPSLKKIILCNTKYASWLDNFEDINITQTSGEDVKLILPI